MAHLNRRTERTTRAQQKTRRPAIPFKANQRVRILQGAHQGKQGQVVRVNGRNAVVKIHENQRQNVLWEDVPTTRGTRRQTRFVSVPAEQLAAHVLGTPRPDPKMHIPAIRRKWSQLGKLEARLESHHQHENRQRWQKNKTRMTEWNRQRGLPDFFHGQQVQVTQGPLANKIADVYNVEPNRVVLVIGNNYRKQIRVPVSFVKEVVPPTGKRIPKGELGKIKKRIQTLKAELKKLR